ncbi:MAG TPA: DUF92 domain-containing protein [Terriglobales bacterium]|nr:DUF92 domain-containing protein [Terriglobales bacterium]
MSPLLLISQTLPELHHDAVSDRVLPALVVTVAFGLLAWILRGVTISGALAGTLTAFVIYLGFGWSGFVTLIAVFVVTLISTRIGLSKKRQLGLAEGPHGRSAAQVLANLAAAAVFAALAVRHAWFAVAAVAAMAEAAADTTQSEIGEIASSRAWLITNFRPVPPGTNGGVTLAGLLAGAIAAAIVAGVAGLTHAIEPRWAGIAGSSGFLATLIDSILGATLERRGSLNNNAVNFLSTIVAGTIAIAFVRFVFL